MTSAPPECLELCAGAGGQALGLEQAGIGHQAVVEIDPNACATLRANRPGWKVVEGDLRHLDGREYRGIDLVAAGPPCPPFSIGGQQLGEDDERNLFPEVLRIVGQAEPRAVMIENVKGLGLRKFRGFRWDVAGQLHGMGYHWVQWQLVNCSQFGVPQLRPRMVLIAVRGAAFSWPYDVTTPPTAGMALYDLMRAGGWEWAATWATDRCNAIAPTIVGGSKKHGGPDLGPTRARAAWRELGVNGSSIAGQAPGPDEPRDHLPRLTIPMVARLQGFPDDWQFTGGKTAAYRQVGNAFPPPVARAFGQRLVTALKQEENHARYTASS